MRGVGPFTIYLVAADQLRRRVCRELEQRAAHRAGDIDASKLGEAPTTDLPKHNPVLPEARRPRTHRGKHTGSRVALKTTREYARLHFLVTSVRRFEQRELAR